MCRKIKDRKLTFILNPDDSWEKIDVNMRIVANSAWNEVKFLDNTCNNLDNSMQNLPDDKGGIYIFIVKPEIVPNTHLYILYIGRAQNTASQNLKKRCCEYLNDTRPKIFAMKESWGKNLYIRYLPLTDNNIINKLEEELIEAILPPCNDKYPRSITRAAVKQAFM